MSGKSYDDISSSLKNYQEKGGFKISQVSGEGVTGIELSPFSLKDLADFFSEVIGKDIEDYIPSDFTSVLNDLEITSEAAIKGSDKNKGLTLVKEDGQGFRLSFAVEWTKPWNIDNALTIINPYAAFSISAEAVSAVLCSGDISFNQAQLNLELTAKIPSFLITAELSKNASANSTSHYDLAKEYLGSLQKPNTSTFQVADIRLTAAPFVKTYELYLSVDNLLQAGPLNVKQFQADIKYQGGLDGGYDLLAWANIELPPKSQPIDIVVTAQRKVDKATKDGVWKFEGSLAHPVPFGDVLKDLNELFGAGNSLVIPDPISKLIIEKLSLSFDSDSSPEARESTFSFIMELLLPLDGKELDLIITAEYEKKSQSGKSSYELDLSGIVQIGAYQFEIDFRKEEGEGSSQALSKASILSASLKSSGSVDLTKILAEVTTDKELENALPDITIDLEEVFFALFKGDNNANKYLFGLGLAVDLDFDLSKLPVVGKILHSQGKYGIDSFRFFLASQSFYEKEILLFPDSERQFIMGEQPGTSGTSADSVGSTSSIPVLTKGANFRAVLDLGTMKKTIPQPPTRIQGMGNMSPGSAGQNIQGIGSQTATAGQVAPSRATDAQAQWINIQKSIGPFTFERIGVNYKSGKLWFFITASLSAGGLSITLDGLGLGSPIDHFDLDAKLMGMSLTFQGGPVEISGGFIESDDPNKKDTHRYAGEALVKGGPFSLSAMGMYTSSPTEDSFFAFAMLDIPLGGPPIFFVTGLAGGFGYNSKLNLPSIRNLNRFLLVEGALPPPPGGMNPLAGDKDKPGAILNQLMGAGADGRPDVQPLRGEDWAGVGVRFTSYELVQSFALLTVSFGVQLEIGILGRSQISIPSKDPNPIAFAEIDLEAIISPDAVFPEPIFMLEARLANGSHIFSNACRLMGGFAFCIWPNGDFVVTLGGYHPHFQTPVYYPQVDRLGILWQIGNFLVIKGQLFFALTPSAIMAGGGIQVLFHAGPVRAWFIAEADFLLSWKPFHYELGIMIDLGVSLDLFLFSITLNIGVGLQLWGPPFGGVAHVKLWIISFSIPFGAHRNPPPPLQWADFARSFLPKGEDKSASGNGVAQPMISTGASLPGSETVVTMASVSKGLIKNDSEFGAILKPHGFELLTHSAVPANNLSINAADSKDKLILTDTWTTTIGIIPMQKTDIQSVHKVDLYRREENSTDYELYEYTHERLTFEGVLQNGPKSLWSNKGIQSKEDQLGGDTTIAGLLMGVRINAKELHSSQTQEIPVASLQDELEELVHCAAFPSKTAGPTSDKESNLDTALGRIESAMAKSQEKRSAILEALTAAGFSLSENVKSNYCSPSEEALDESPIFIS